MNNVELPVSVSDSDQHPVIEPSVDRPVAELTERHVEVPVIICDFQTKLVDHSCSSSESEDSERVCESVLDDSSNDCGPHFPALTSSDARCLLTVTFADNCDEDVDVEPQVHTVPGISYPSYYCEEFPFDDVRN